MDINREALLAGLVLPTPLCSGVVVPSNPESDRSASSNAPHSSPKRSKASLTNDSIAEDSEEELQAALQPRQDAADYQVAIPFENPLDLLIYFDENIQSGAVNPHKWQKEEQLFLGRKDIYTREQPLMHIIVAANGSGKDAYINAPFAIWFCMCKVRSRCVITSASYTQLKNQTESYIRNLANRINYKLAEQGICEKMFIVKKEHIVCTLTGSEIVMFVTDDAGRAEGFHPFPDYNGSELAIIINEAKTVPQEIFNALLRCTYHVWLEISSPGKTSGHLYDIYSRSRDWREGYKKGQPFSRRITSYDCPHISREKIEQDKINLGENSPTFRSKHLAEFTSIDEQVVITPEQVTKCLSNATNKIPIGLGIHAGLDLAGGGDENALYVFDENIYLGREVFRAEDTEVTVDLLTKDFFPKWNLTPDKINADGGAGGIGQSILDGLARVVDEVLAPKGWIVNRITNQSRPRNPKGQYANRGAELYFTFARLVQECKIILPEDDDMLIKQLGNRYYGTHKTLGRIVLQSKKEARAEGRPSPDRADAVVLAFAGVTIMDYLDSALLKIPVGVKKALPPPMKIAAQQQELVKSWHMRNSTREHDRSIVDVKTGLEDIRRESYPMRANKNPALLMRKLLSYARK